MKLVNSLNQKQIEQLHNLYKNEWWCKTRTLKQSQEVVKNSSLIFAIIDENDNLLAFCRVISDFIFKAFIFDVIVAKEHRGKGLGDMLINAVIKHPKLVGVESIELYCLPQMEVFYSKYGFKKLEGIVFLRRARV